MHSPAVFHDNVMTRDYVLSNNPLLTRRASEGNLESSVSA